jgi:hypothetical protein
MVRLLMQSGILQPTADRSQLLLLLLLLPLLL